MKKLFNNSNNKFHNNDKTANNKISNSSNNKSFKNNNNRLSKNSKNNNRRNLKQASIATISTVIFLTAIIVINLLVGKIDLSKDLTKNKMFTLSEQTNKVLDNLKEDINIYAFYETGKENYTVNTLLKEYQSRSKHIKVMYKDPNKDPQVVEKYTKDNEKPQIGSIIVECGSKFKVIDENSLVNIGYDASGSTTIESLAIEQNITSRIISVTSSNSTTVYFLEGHGEAALSSQISKQLELENFSVDMVNLSMKDAKLKDNSTLIINSPKRDLSEPETKTIKEFLAKGGKTLFLMDLVEDTMPNFDSLFKEYGIQVQKAIAVESNSMFVTQNPLYLLPKQQSHEILNPLNNSNLRTLIPGAQSIKILDKPKSSLTIQPLLVTSDKSWAKTNLHSDTVEKTSSDINGPLNVAVSITNKISSDKESRIVVVGNGSFINPQISSLSSNANLDFFMNSVNWCADRKDSLSIRPKSFEDYSLQLNAFQKLTFTGMVVILIPGIVLVWGITVWLKRRKK